MIMMANVNLTSDELKVTANCRNIEDYKNM